VVAGIVGEVTGKYMPYLGIRHPDLAADPALLTGSRRDGDVVEFRFNV
jgi:hypothetical protein